MIKQVDKGNAIVLKDTEYFRDLAEDHLKDITFYFELALTIDHCIVKKLDYNPSLPMKGTILPILC